MFQRRKPLHWVDRIAQFIWPRQGWRRAGSYVAHRLRRLPGTPYRIAAGFASGAAVSFTPFIGLHFVLAGLLAVVLRGNVMAAAIGTVVGNPWTFPLIWAWIYGLGVWILGGNGTTGLPEELSFSYIFDHPLQVLAPMTVGAVPTAVAAWFLCFFPLRRMVDRYQTARLKRLRRKMDKRQRKLAAVAKIPFERAAETRK